MLFDKIPTKIPYVKTIADAWPFLIPCLLATWLYAPAFFCGKIQIFGDSIIHSLSVLELNRKMLHEGISPLWTNLLYGGHPYFAEGQGGFLNPLNLIVSLFCNPVAGQHLYHWLAIIVGALGIFSLCRHFRCGLEASTFGALVVVFSSFWIQYHDNVTIAGALCFVPWALLCFESWLELPSIKSALWLALSVSVLIFAGYPQVLHGAVIFMAVSLIPTLLAGCIRSRADNAPKQYALTGLAAVAACIGLSAIQWVPLLELASLSHRSGGTDLASVAANPLYRYIGGFLFSISDADKTIVRGLGSVFVCFIASLSLLIKPGHRTIGYLIATVFLMILGMENATPVFACLRNYSLVPGLKYFRIVHLYLGIGIIGIGLLASIALNSIQQQEVRPAGPWKAKTIFIAGATILFLIWAGLALRLRVEQVTILQYTSFIGAGLALIIFILINKQPWFGYAMLFLLVLEIVVLRIAPVPFSDPKLLEKPPLVSHIQANISGKNYKIMDISSSWIVGLLTLWDARLETENHKAFLRVSPSTNVLWDIPSMGANLALPLARHQMIQSRMKAEIEGTDPAVPGTRLIDYLGVRYISADAMPPTKGFMPWKTDGVTIMENRHALPRIQNFTRYEMASSAEDALNRLKQTGEPTLILEPPLEPSRGLKSLPASAAANDPKALELLSTQATNVQYRLDVRARQPAWLFIADANYPGWQAWIDGRETPVYSAQILGKAVFVPTGRHQISVEFKPRSLLIGLWVTLLTLTILLVMGIRSTCRSNHKSRK